MDPDTDTAAADDADVRRVYTLKATLHHFQDASVDVNSITNIPTQLYSVNRRLARTLFITFHCN